MKVADDTSGGTLECEWVKFPVTIIETPTLLNSLVLIVHFFGNLGVDQLIFLGGGGGGGALLFRKNISL